MSAVRSLDAPKTQSFEGRKQPSEAVGYRLPPSHIATLRAVFTESESDAGMKTSWWEGVDCWAGLVAEKDAVHLFDAERWCDTQSVFADEGRGARMRRCREAMVDLVEGGDSASVTVLYRVYGPLDPNARFDLFPEVAPLVELTQRVDEARVRLASSVDVDRVAAWRERVATVATPARVEALRARRVGLREKVRAWEAARAAASAEGADVEPVPEELRRELDAVNAALRAIARGPGEIERLDPVKIEAGIRAQAGLEVTTADAVRVELDTTVSKREGETPANFNERRAQRLADRTSFILDVRKQAAALLERASIAYRVAWAG